MQPSQDLGNGFLHHGIARINPSDHGIALLSEAPIPITLGGDWLDGRIYFGSGSHIYSYRIDP